MPDDDATDDIGTPADDDAVVGDAVADEKAAGPDDAAGWAAPDQASRAPAADPTAPSSTPPPPPPTAPMTPPPGVAPATGAPAQRRGRAWVVVLVAILGAIVVVIAAGTALFFDRTKPPYDAAQGFFEDLLDFPQGEVNASRFCSRDRENLDAALAEVGESLATISRAEILVNFLGVDRSGDLATVKYSVDPNVGTTRTYELPLRDEGGTWKVCPSDGIREVDN